MMEKNGADQGRLLEDLYQDLTLAIAAADEKSADSLREKIAEIETNLGRSNSVE